ncbi:Alpha/Beta hydrolase protein [Rhizoctonia solani]|nr:Alpha/Beta hydrolase protein [Rhizoctonia solani]
MSLLGPLLLGTFALASTVNASPWTLPEGYHRFAPRAEGFSWGNCGEGVPTSRECSRFEVPLDWADPSAGKATLAVARYQATKKPKLGTLFANPGGPGGSGVDMILGDVETISAAAGGQYDILSWDPRGIGQTVPRADCFKTGTEENAFWEGTIPRAGLEARGNFTDQRDLDAFYEQVDEVDVLLEELGKRCVTYSPDTFQYIGSAAAVRDMVAMHDILEGSSKPIDYWGFSYGTIIGVYFVNMFPDRVGRVVLDGVVDPVVWANKPTHEMLWIIPESTDEAFTGFCDACAAAGPSGCALAAKGDTGASIRQKVRDMIDAAYDYKRAVGRSAEIGSSDVRSAIFQGMYQPTQWPELAKKGAEIIQFLHNASSTNSTHAKRSLPAPLLDIRRRQTGTNGTTNDDPAPDYSFQGVTCADAADPGNVTTKDVFDYLVKVTREVSQMFGPMWGDASLYCHRWPVRAVERYVGPWNKKLSNPILVIGNEADPVTPFISAKNVADALGDSAILIEQDDYGHSSLAMHSACTISALQDYFVNNKLPSEDKLCGTDQELFPGPGVTKGTVSKLSTQTMSKESDDTVQDELEDARERGNKLFIAVIALSSAVGVLLLGLVFSCIRGRRKSKVAHATYIPRGAFEKGGDEQGHTYDDPHVKGDAKSGGYARVES